MASIYDWSTVASNNATADSGINWAEGQPPSSVNNSARVMMGRIAELLGDLGGSTAAGGTANALTLTASSAVTAHADGLRMSFRAVAANTGATTLNVNGIGAKPIRKITITGEAALVGGEIREPGIYEVVYCSILNGSAGGWLLVNPTPPASEDPGFIKSFGGSSVPAGYLACNGAAISRTTYAALFAAIGTAWGVGDGSNTFNLPNLVDDFIRGAGGTRTVGTREAQAIQSHGHTASQEPHSHIYTAFSTRGNAAGGGDVPQAWSGANTYNTTEAAPAITVNPAGGAETRPRNVAVLFVIKT